MSQAFPHRARPVGLKLGWQSIVALAVAVVLAASLTVYLVSRDDGNSSPTPTVQSSGSSGPNETLRGQAVHSAAGAGSDQSTGGPNETLRGRAAVGADTHSP